jgi:prepilin-type N-terminal cleavage/methylation domain-containing protein
MIRRLRDRARDDAGFSLIELMMALAIGSIVLTASMTIFMNGLSATAKVTDRVEAGQRARLAGDRISTLLNAQVCGVGGAAPITEALPTSVTFTANTGTVYAQSTRYRVRWDPTSNTIYEDQWVATGRNADGDPIFPAAVTRTRVIGIQMKPTDGATLFTYYGFDTVNGGIDDTTLPTPVDTNKIIAIDYSLTAMPERTKIADPRSTTINGQAVAGTADPSDPTRGNTC